MNRYSHDKRGVTLVELLVVIAIIGILTSAAIPILSRLSGFASSKNQEASRDLYTILKAAQIYASTHNTDTAVIYIAREYTDSLDEGPSPAATQYMVVRRINSALRIVAFQYHFSKVFADLRRILKHLIAYLRHRRLEYLIRPQTSLKPRESQSRFGLLNARVGLEGDNWGLYLWSKNLTDERYLDSALDNGINGVRALAGDPCTYGIEARLRF